jgi:2-iminobutanoate/2-iminopropanoate deaminase
LFGRGWTARPRASPSGKSGLHATRRAGGMIAHPFVLRWMATRIRDQLHKEKVMPRTRLPVPDIAEVAPGLWSNAIPAGDTLYISGQVARPFEGGTEIVGNNEYEQARQIFSRIDRIIKAAGGTMDDLVKMTIYVVNIKNNTEVWRARREFFAGDFPASTLVEVRSLAGPDVLVEIEAVAYFGKG